MSRKLLIVSAIALLAAGAAGVWVGVDAGEEEGARDPAGEASLAIPADVVEFPTLDGDTASLADHRGEVVLLNLWGTWCHPCLREIPDLVELQGKIEPRGGTIVGLAVDSGSPEEIRTFAERHGINYPIWHSSGRRVMEHYRAMGYPTTLLIDRQGVIRERFVGVQTAPELMAALEPYLEG